MSTTTDSVTQDILANAFTSIAEEMAVVEYRSRFESGRCLDPASDDSNGLPPSPSPGIGYENNNEERLCRGRDLPPFAQPGSSALPGFGSS